MNKSNKKEIIYSAVVLFFCFIFLCSFSIPESNSIICKNGLLSVHIENMVLEDFARRLNNDCNINIYIDDKAKSYTLNANFDSYPIPYGISKILEGTGFNFVIFKDELAEKAFTIYIGPTKGVSEQPTFSSVSSKNPNPSYNYSNPSPQYNYNPPIQQEYRYKSQIEKTEETKAQPYQAPYVGYTYSIHPAGSPDNKSQSQKIEIPTAGADIKTTPPNPRQIYSPPGKIRRQTPSYRPPSKPSPTPIPPPTPSYPPPNTGSG